jgi:Glycosyl transferase family 2
MPTVSIVVPNYNYARFLSQRLGSIEKQTFKDFEVILVDDASTDDSFRIFEQFARKYPSQLVRNDVNSGNVFKVWNRGIPLATGKYVWIAESDDYADERFLETLVNRLEANPGCGLAYCASLRVNEMGSVTELALPKTLNADLDRWRQDFVADGREECRRYLLRENTIPNASAVLFRRELYDRLGGADENLRLCADWKFYASVLRESDIAFVAEPLNYFRTHGTTTRARTRTWTQLAEGLQVMRYIIETVGVPRSDLQELHAGVALVFFHSLIKQVPSATELDRVRKLLPEIDFGLSRRAVSSFLKQALEFARSRITGAHNVPRVHAGTMETIASSRS